MGKNKHFSFEANLDMLSCLYLESEYNKLLFGEQFIFISFVYLNVGSRMITLCYLATMKGLWISSMINIQIY